MSTLHGYFSMMLFAFGFKDARYQKRVLILGCASTLILTYYIGWDDCFVFKILTPILLGCSDFCCLWFILILNVGTYFCYGIVSYLPQVS